MRVIREADVSASVADALQYISYYHTPDFIRAMGRAYDMEQSPSARDAIAQILTNSRMCAEGHRPICQDTGIVVVFVKVGMGVTWDAKRDLESMINEGVRRAYLNPDNKLRASIVSDPAFKRANTRDNTPAVIHTELAPGDALDITVAAKGGGSENKSLFAMLNPSDSVADWVVDMVPEMGAGWGPAVLEPPNLDLWPKVQWRADESARRVFLDGLTRTEIQSWKPGERLLLSGKLLTGRDRAGKPLPDGLDFTGRVIYYVGPVDPVGTEVVGPAGPTTANRMDRFTDTMLGKSGLLAMVGKAERGPETVASIAKHRSAYLIAVGGAAFLVSNAIRGSRVVAFPELGMEAVYEFDVRDMPVTVAVSSDGVSVHETGPKAWAGKFAGIPVTVE